MTKLFSRFLGSAFIASYFRLLEWPLQIFRHCSKPGVTLNPRYSRVSQIGHPVMRSPSKWEQLPHERNWGCPPQQGQSAHGNRIAPSRITGLIGEDPEQQMQIGGDFSNRTEVMVSQTTLGPNLLQCSKDQPEMLDLTLPSQCGHTVPFLLFTISFSICFLGQVARSFVGPPASGLW